MNSIDDLRRTVADLPDPDLAARPSAVRDRVRRIQRRRRAAGAAGLAATVAVVGGIAFAVGAIDDPPQPANQTVVGVDVPQTLSSLGYTYRVVDTVAGEDGRVRVDLTADDGPRLVAWATSGEDDSVRVSGDTVTDAYRTAAADFTDWTVVPAGEPARIAVAAEDGTPGLAVYELTDARPEGETVGGVTFRDEVAGARLLGAVAGEPGETSIELPARTASGDAGIELYAACVGTSSGGRLAVDVADTEGASVRMGDGVCGETVPVDGTTDIAPVGRAAKPDTDVTTTVTLRPVGDGDLPADARLVVGVYATPVSPTDNRTDPTVIEDSGHLWEKVAVHEARQQRSLNANAPAGDQESVVLLSWRTPGTGPSTLHTWYDGHRGASYANAGTSGFSSTRQVVSPGAPVRARVNVASDLRMAFYQRVD
ncbi:hypothetical protein [Nocardioides sambongensis]|uniref:hypothetical protein n=1 Tax=Nocardioides sambongensis TaxID=2589074 RepID=UPI001128BE76|nr:hypothetical protein [Nocardioides sambongensis]